MLYPLSYGGRYSVMVGVSTSGSLPVKLWNRLTPNLSSLQAVFHGSSKGSIYQGEFRILDDQMVNRQSVIDLKTGLDDIDRVSHPAFFMAAEFVFDNLPALFVHF